MKGREHRKSPSGLTSPVADQRGSDGADWQRHPVNEGHTSMNASLVIVLWNVPAQALGYSSIMSSSGSGVCTTYQCMLALASHCRSGAGQLTWIEAVAAVSSSDCLAMTGR